MSAFQQYIISPWLTPVRVVATSNVSGTYNNGPVNNGLASTLTVNASSLTIDSVVVNVADRILLSAQTSAFQNGVYVVLTIGSTVVLQRAADQQCMEQLHTGQYVTVSAGTTNAGSAFVLVEPKPAALGVNNLVWTASPLNSGLGTAAAKAASDNSQPTLSSVNGATATNAVAIFADTAGSVKAQTTTATLGFGLTAATGNITATAGNLLAGSSGNAGTVSSFPGTAANGQLILAGVNAGGAFNTTISNGTMGQSTVYTMGDIGAATGGLVVATSAIRMKSVAQAAVAGGAAAQTVTDTFCTSASMVTCTWNDTSNAVTIQKAVAGNGSFVVTSSGDPGASHLNYIITK